MAATCQIEISDGLRIEPIRHLRSQMLTVAACRKKGMDWELLLWILSFFAVCAVLSIVIYQLLCLSDLELDYINPYDSTLRINKFVIPDFAIHGALSFTYLTFGFWLMFLLNLPLIYFHFRLYSRKHYLVDVTEIFNQLQYEKKYRFIKLIFYFILLCIVFVRMLVAAIA